MNNVPDELILGSNRGMENGLEDAQVNYNRPVA
jgi:hypothetical protein